MLKEELSVHEKTWRNLKYMLLTERCQPNNATYCMIPTIRQSEKGKTMQISGHLGTGEKR